METTRYSRLLNGLRYLLCLPLCCLTAPLLSLLSGRLFSFVTLREFYLSLLFFRFNLLPKIVEVDPASSVHLWIPARRRTGKPSLVLIHGFGGNSKWQWHDQIGPLSKSFDLYIPDLMFFGLSRSDGGERSVEFQGRCLVETMRRLGVGKYSVAGISYGGFVAFRMAEMAAAEVERVVIMTAGICVTPEQRKEMLEREGRDVSEIFLPEKAENLMTLIRRSLYRPPRWIPEFVLNDFIEVMYKDRRKERVEMLKELLTNGAGVKPLPVLNQETLILWGDRDIVFPLCLAYQLQKHLGEKARLEVIKDAGHALQLEKPDLVNHHIQWFLLEAK